MPPATCANPLLLGWIKEIYDLAVERNTKGVTTYRRAYNSMKACPLTFSHPSEAQQLDGIGPKICDILTDKLKEHCEANGLPAPKKSRGKARKRLSVEDLADVGEPAPAKKPRKSKAYVPSFRSGPYAVILALSSLPEDSLQSLTKAQLTELAQPHCDSSFTVPSEAGKFYTAWNSMKTLLDKDLVHERGRPLRKYALTDEGWEVARRMRAVQEDDAVKQTTKPSTEKGVRETGVIGGLKPTESVSGNVHGFLDLERESDPEKSTQKPQRQDHVSGTMEATSSAVGQRLGGAPVDRYGTFSRRERTPVRHVAVSKHNIVNLSSSPEPQPTMGFALSSTTFSKDSRHLKSREMEPVQPTVAEATNNPSAATLSSHSSSKKSRTSAPQPFQPSYAQAMNTSTIDHSSKRFLLGNSTGRSKPPSPEPFQPNFAQAMDAYSASAAPGQAPGAKPTRRPRPPSPEPFQPNCAQAMDAYSASTAQGQPPLTKPKRRPKPPSPAPFQPNSVPAMNSLSAPALSTQSVPEKPSTIPRRSPSEPSRPVSAQAATVPSAIASSTKPSPLAPPALPTFTPIPIQPGTFTVHLVLDNREVRAKDDRDYISDELTKKGAKPLVRPLELGDFFWVAKLHSPTLLSTNGEEGDEIALDWIVERKRLDDLVGSITDGRFQEQKFRLRKSGVKNVVYLIEAFSISSEKATKFHDAIQSAIASTQVVNGYFVKQTGRLDETIRYLARMTAMLKTLYESKPLHLIPTTALTPTTYLPLLTHLRTHPAHSDKSYHITYPSFASLSSKSDTLTLRDVFLKMLMCTRGVSGDKALAIQKQWATPRALVEAFETCGGGKERDGLVEGRLGAVVGRGKVGRVLGAKVADVWGVE